MRLSRKSLFTARALFALPPRDSGIMTAMVRVHPSWIDVDRKDTRRLYRRQPVLLHNRENGFRTLRFAFGAGDIDIQVPTTIAIDYDCRDALGIRGERLSVAIEVLQASYWDVMAYYWGHPDMALQLSTRLGIVGFFLGIISLF